MFVDVRVFPLFLLAPPNLLMFSSGGDTRAFEEKLQFPPPGQRRTKPPSEVTTKMLKVVSLPAPPRTGATLVVTPTEVAASRGCRAVTGP